MEHFGKGHRTKQGTERTGEQKANSEMKHQ